MIAILNQFLRMIKDFKKSSSRFKKIYRIYPNSIQENQRMSTCNRLDLQTLGSRPIVPKNLPDHWSLCSHW